MQTAMFLASIFGPFIGILGLWMLIYSENLSKVLTSMKNTPCGFYLLGLINLLLGLTIVNQYNVWVWDLSVLLTLLGWVWIVRAILIFFVPQLIVKVSMTGKSWIKVMGIIPLIWGILLCWFAFHQ